MSIRTKYFIYAYKGEDESKHESPYIGEKKYVFICVFRATPHPHNLNTDILYLKKRYTNKYDTRLGIETIPIRNNFFFSYLGREINNILISQRENTTTKK